MRSSSLLFFLVAALAPKHAVAGQFRKSKVTKGDFEPATYDAEFEYGDSIAHARDVDANAYTAREFIAKDDARDAMGSDDTEENARSLNAQRERALARQDDFNSEDTPDPDALVQKATRRVRTKKGDFEPATYDAEFEYGDSIAHARDVDANAYTAREFIAKDDARDAMGSDDTEENARSLNAQRERALARQDDFNSEDTPDPDAFVQKAARRMRTKKGDFEPATYDAEFEYGDSIAHARDVDANAYTAREFIAKDDARDAMGSDDTEENARSLNAQRERALARQDDFNSEDTPDPDALVQKATRRVRTTKGDFEPATYDAEFEYGDSIAHARDVDANAYTAREFIAKDDARDAMGSDDTEENARSLNAQRERALARQDDFNSEDTPDPDALVQKATRRVRTKKGDFEPATYDAEFEYGDSIAHARDVDANAYTAREFIAKDDARDAMGSDDTEENARSLNAQRERALARQDDFNSEDTPDPDAFMQKATRRVRTKKGDFEPATYDAEFEYGDSIAHARDVDANAYTAREFIAKDDARDAMGSDDTEENARSLNAQRERALARQDDFNSEDTPDPDALVQKATRRVRTTKGDFEPATYDAEFEYGDSIAHARDVDANAYTAREFIAKDDARDAMGSDDTEENARSLNAQRERALARQDDFNSEDTPDPDA